MTALVCHIIAYRMPKLLYSWISRVLWTMLAWEAATETLRDRGACPSAFAATVALRINGSTSITLSRIWSTGVSSNSPLLDEVYTIVWGDLSVTFRGKWVDIDDRISSFPQRADVAEALNALHSVSFGLPNILLLKWDREYGSTTRRAALGEF